MPESSQSTVTIFAPDKLLTLGAQPNRGDAMAVLGASIVEVAPLSELRDRFPHAEVERLRGTVLPAFNDGHQHMAIAGADMACVDASALEIKTLGDLQRRIEVEAADVGPGEWVRVVRYDNMKLEGRHRVTRDDLDAWAPQNPVFLQEASYHWGVLNSSALDYVGIDESSVAPAGGSFGRFDDGRLDGMLYEQAWQDLSLPSKSSRDRTLPMRSRATWRKGMLKAQDVLHGMGIASITDAFTGPSEHDVYQDLHDAGELSMRVNCLVSVEKWRGLRELGLRTGFGSEQLRIGGVKLVADGAVGGRTCAMDEPFEGSDDRGMMTLSDEDLYSLLYEVHSAGSVAAVHANGDRAIRHVLHAFERVLADAPGQNLRHRIEHCTVVTPDILDAMHAMNLSAAPFSTYVWQHGAKFLEWFGERVEWMFPHRSFLDRGIPVIGASDFPAGLPSPLLGIASCVSRRGSSGEAVGLSQRITVDEALRIYTQGSAYGESMEHVKGTLADGYLADFVVLDQDPFDLEAEPAAIAEIEVLATYVGGVNVL